MFNKWDLINKIPQDSSMTNAAPFFFSFLFLILGSLLFI